MHELLPMMNEPFAPLIWDRLLGTDTYLFKLTYKWQFAEKKDGEDTIYSFIIKNYG